MVWYSHRSTGCSEWIGWRNSGVLAYTENIFKHIRPPNDLEYCIFRCSVSLTTFFVLWGPYQTRATSAPLQIFSIFVFLRLMKSAVRSSWLSHFVYAWCGSPSHCYFCTTEIGYPFFPQYLIPLAKTLHLMRGDDWLEEIQIGAKPTEI